MQPVPGKHPVSQRRHDAGANRDQDESRPVHTHLSLNGRHCSRSNVFKRYNLVMASPPPLYKAHRCSFHPDRQDPYLRLSTVTVFVRDQERALRFYLDQLGFTVAYDARSASGTGWLAVAPPDGTAVVALVAPTPGSEEYKLIGRSTEIVFLTENVSAKYDEWRSRGVHFLHAPETQSWGAVSTRFEDA